MDIQSAARKAGRKVGRILSAGEDVGTDTDTDILDLLQKDHDDVEDLLDQLVESRNGSERKSLLKKVKSTLVPHVRAEEKVVYDAVIAFKGKKEAQDGEEGYLEHGLADRMLATLGKISGVMSPEFGAAAKVLKELVLHHVREEENNIWPDVREHFSDDERVAMGRKFLLAKHRAADRLSE